MTTKTKMKTKTRSVSSYNQRKSVLWGIWSIAFICAIVLSVSQGIRSENSASESAATRSNYTQSRITHGPFSIYSLRKVNCGHQKGNTHIFFDFSGSEDRKEISTPFNVEFTNKSTTFCEISDDKARVIVSASELSINAQGQSTNTTVISCSMPSWLQAGTVRVTLRNLTAVIQTTEFTYYSDIQFDKKKSGSAIISGRFTNNSKLKCELQGLTQWAFEELNRFGDCEYVDSRLSFCSFTKRTSLNELIFRRKHLTIQKREEDSSSVSGSGGIDQTLVIVGAVVSTGLCGVAIFVCFIGCYCRQKSGYKNLNNSDFSSNQINLDELELDELIGVGNFGQVYRGSWRGMEVAVKKLPLQFDEQMLIDFKREIQILRLVQHPNIVKFYGASVKSPDFCIVTEFVANGSLYKILHNPEAIEILTEKMLKSIAIDTAEGMKYLHTRDPPIIHRDIKSHNILLSKGWRVKICDFGLSKVLDKSNDQKKMSLCGTPSWAAPEVLRNQPYSEKADIYSFGIVLWEMVTRSDPFGGMPPFQIVFAVGSQGQRPPIPADCSHDWQMLIRDCWDENPNKRPTIPQIISRLQSFESY